MTGNARKFISRSPRYTLRPTDDRYLRFAHADEKGQSYTTRIRDISTSGLAFITDRLHSPDVSEVIKVEIPLGENQTIAWFARVTRVEEYSSETFPIDSQSAVDEHQVLVGITFLPMPPGHEKAIRATLEKKLYELHQHETKIRLQKLGLFFLSRFWQVLLYVGCIAMTAYFLWAISRPGKDYDADIGAPWGQRFQWLNFFTPPEQKAVYEDLKIKRHDQENKAPEQ